MARPLFGAFAFVLCGSFLSESAQSFNLTILHTNDVHARVEELNAFGGRCRPGRPCYGGFARLGAKVAEVRGRDDNVLFLDAGDQFQGTLWYYFFKSPVVAQLMNKVTYDAMPHPLLLVLLECGNLKEAFSVELPPKRWCKEEERVICFSGSVPESPSPACLNYRYGGVEPEGVCPASQTPPGLVSPVAAIGNHEFDDGVPELNRFLRLTNFTVLSANIDATREPEFHRSVTLNVGGERIGIVGYTTEDTPAISKPGDTVSFTSVVTSVQAEVDRLTQQGVNKVIALGHAGRHACPWS
ncbi:5'-nucleotidase [Branchiostoma belcheri]|nr:5'-nucleotidase [Branchiostoma belcheri]